MARALCAMGFFFIPCAVQAATITVTSLLDNTFVDGQVTLREAITAANTDSSVDGSVAGNGADRIVFAISPGAIVLGTTLSISDELTIEGPGADQLTIDGDGSHRLFEVSARVELHDLALRDGLVIDGYGAGVLNFGDLLISDCVLMGHAANFDGGAISNEGTLEIVRSRLSANSAQNGGAIENYFGTVVIRDSTLSDNFTGGIAPFAGGGGAIVNSGYMTIVDSTFSDNEAGNGGAIVAGDSTQLFVSNSTFSANGALNNGGAISSFQSNLSISSSTFAANRADTDNDAVGAGGAIRASPGSVTVMKNNVVAGNFVGSGLTASDVDGTVLSSSSFNLIGVDTGLVGILNGTQGNQIGTAAAPIDPELGLLQDNGGPTFTHELMTGSPAIDAGQFTLSATTDQRGVTRPQGDQSDIGAFEVYAGLPIPMERTVSNVTFFSFDVEEACGTIVAGPAVTVSATGELVFRAGTQIELRNGFSVQSGARFFVLLQLPTGC